MDHHSVAYVGFDTSKTKHAVAVAEGGREGEVRYLGEIEAAPAAVERLLRKLERQYKTKYKTLHVCYEAGPTGYGLYRHIRALGHACDVIAPSLVPKRPGDHVKTNRRDAVTLARLLRAGELTAIWVPDEVHEAVRDLVRAREAAAQDLRHKRQQVLSFLLRLFFVTGAPSRAIATGAERTYAGSPGRPSTTRPSRSFSKTKWMPWLMPRPASSGWIISWPSLSRPGRWRPWWLPVRRCGASPSWSR